MLFFVKRGKPGNLEKKHSEQGREPTTNSTHICHQAVIEPGHINRRRAITTTLSLLAKFTAVIRQQSSSKSTNLSCGFCTVVMDTAFLSEQLCSYSTTNSYTFCYTQKEVACHTFVCHPLKHHPKMNGEHIVKRLHL